MASYSYAVPLSQQRIYGNLSILAIVQLLSISVQVALLPTIVLTGLRLTEGSGWSNLPLSTLFGGAVVGTIMTSHVMHRYGWRYGFTFGQFLSLLGGIGLIYAVSAGIFWLFCVTAFIFGLNNAFWLQLRFAAIDTVDKKYKGRAVGFILVSGVIAAFVGSQMSGFGYRLLAVDHLGTFFLVSITTVVNIILLQFIDIPRKILSGHSSRGRVMSEIFLSYGFFVAFITAMVGYGVMNLVMSATPIVIQLEGLDFPQVRSVIQWHVFAMFAPSLGTGFLVEKFGSRIIIFAGVMLNIFCFMTVFHGQDSLHFHSALIVLGLGWNFMFVGATILLAEQYRPEEASKVQSFNDFFIFSAVSVTSLSSAILVGLVGWVWLNILALILVLSVACLLVSEIFYRRFQKKIAAEKM